MHVFGKFPRRESEPVQTSGIELGIDKNITLIRRETDGA
jgi:hypothetical protein